MSTSVNEAFKRLEGIQQADVPKDLFAKIQNRIGESKVIPMHWVRLAAAVIALLIATEFYWVSHYSINSQSSEIESLLPDTDNGIYYE